MREAGAALIGRIATPQQLAPHFVIQADEIRLDEAAVRLQPDHAVRQHRSIPGSSSSCDRSRSGAYIGCGNVGAVMTGSISGIGADGAVGGSSPAALAADRTGRR